MTESEVWQQIEQYAIEGNWTGVGVLGDWLQEQGIAEGETVCWWAKQSEPYRWNQYQEGEWNIHHLADYSDGYFKSLRDTTRMLHQLRTALKALLT